MISCQKEKLKEIPIFAQKMPTYFHIGYEFDPASVRERIDAQLGEGRGAGYIVVADGNVLVQVHRDPDYREIVQGAIFSICDSGWVPLYLKRLYGFQPQQYSGSDIFRDLTEAGKYRMAFLGASQEVLDALRANLSQTDPRIAEMPFKALPYADADGFDYESIAADLNATAPDIVWVALGAPKQEQFAARLTPLLGRGVVIPVGAVFNFRAGLGIRRAPQWMIRCHLEFVYRIFSEPRKQLRRVWQILRYTPAILGEERGRRDSQA